MKRQRQALVVDDVQELRQSTGELVAGMGYRVLLASSGEEALELLQQEDQGVDLVVSDVFMPGMGGLELLRHLRAAHPRLPVVLASSRHQHPPLQERARQGDVVLLAKPFSGSALRAAMEGAQEAARLAAEPESGPAAMETRPRRIQRWLPVAVAMLGLAFLVPAFQRPPSLPASPDLSVARGSHLELLFPVGDTDDAPESFGWQQIEGVSQYRLTLRTVDQEVLWQTLSPRSPIPLPTDVATRLRPAATYLWSVEALDDAGERLAWSEQTRFHLKLAPTAEAASKT